MSEKIQFAKMCLLLRFILSCIAVLVTSVNVTSSSEASHFEYSSPALATFTNSAQVAILHRDDKILMICRKGCLYPNQRHHDSHLIYGVQNSNLQPNWFEDEKLQLVHILALISLFQIETNECTYMLLKHHFVNTMFQP